MSTSRGLRRAGSVASAMLVAAAIFPAGAMAQSADLSLALSDSPDPVATGSELVYGITVANAGPDTATEVSVRNILPNQVDHLTSIASQGNCMLQGSKRVNCALGSLAGGATATITIRVRADRAGTAENTASVEAGESDPVPANNEAREQTVIRDAAERRCGGHRVDIVGTSEADVLTGTEKRDVIHGLGGDDEIRGLAGNDIICGGGGGDSIKGGAGADLIRGGPGSDRIRGNGGDDRLFGNGADDSLHGNRGDDVLSGARGVDTCRGGKGDDSRRSCEK
jgi:uncharacterized repeat protein (TIGR01451 family)